MDFSTLTPIVITGILTYLIGYANRSSEARNQLANKKIEVASRLASLHVRRNELKERSKFLREAKKHLEAEGNTGKIAECEDQMRSVLRAQEALAEQNAEGLLQCNLYLSEHTYDEAKDFMDDPDDADGYMRLVKAVRRDVAATRGWWPRRFLYAYTGWTWRSY